MRIGAHDGEIWRVVRQFRCRDDQGSDIVSNSVFLLEEVFQRHDGCWRRSINQGMKDWLSVKFEGFNKLISLPE